MTDLVSISLHRLEDLVGNEPSGKMDRLVLVSRARLDELRSSGNPNHEPPGSPDGGQFTSGGGGSVVSHTSADTERAKALAEEHPGDKRYSEMYEALKVAPGGEPGSFKGDRYMAFAYKADGELKGAASSFINTNKAVFITHIGSIQAGAGTSLVKAVEEQAAKDGAHAILVFGVDEKTSSFWNKMGFKKDDTGTFRKETGVSRPEPKKPVPASGEISSSDGFTVLVDTHYNDIPPEHEEFLARVFASSVKGKYAKGETKALTSMSEAEDNGVNDKLRGKEISSTLEASSAKILSKLDAAFAKTKLSESVKVWRGIDLDAWNSIRGDLNPGDVKKLDRGFASTSFYKSLGTQATEHVQLEIRVPKGASAVVMVHLSDFKNEGELLLNRDTSYRVISVSKTGAVLEVVP